MIVRYEPYHISDRDVQDNLDPIWSQLPDQRDILPSCCVCWRKPFPSHGPFLVHSRRCKLDRNDRRVYPVNGCHDLTIVPDRLFKERYLPTGRLREIAEHNTGFIVFVTITPYLLQKSSGETAKLKAIAGMIWQASMGAIGISRLMLSEGVGLDEDADRSSVRPSSPQLITSPFRKLADRLTHIIDLGYSLPERS